MIFTIEKSIAQLSKNNTLSWNILSSLPAPMDENEQLGVAGPIAGILHDQLIVAGGANFPNGLPWQGGKKKYRDDIYVMKKTGTGYTWIGKQTLKSSLAYSASVTTSDVIVSIGGENERGISNAVFNLKWDRTHQGIRQVSLPDLPIASTNGSATIIKNKIFYAGGETAGDVSDQFLLLDLQHPDQGWQSLPALPHPVSHALLISLFTKSSKKIYLIGGRRKSHQGISELYEDVFEFDLATHYWMKKKPLPYALSAGTGIAYGPSQIMLFGGDRGHTFHEVEMLLSAMHTESDPIKKQELENKKNLLQSTHPGFDHAILVYDTHKDQWTRIDTIPYQTPVTTIALKWGRYTIIPNGEIKAGIRSPHILAMKTLRQP